MNHAQWYTDKMDIYRTSDRTHRTITKKDRLLIISNVSCRIYSSDIFSTTMRDTAATINGIDKLMCSPDVEICAGDEVLVTRFGDEKPERYFAGKPTIYREPFGAVIPGLAHQEVALLLERRA